jgi:hypothetical protein
MRKTLIACAVTALLVGGGTATASKLITGKDIRNGSVTGKDIRKGSISENRLSRGLRAKIGRTISGSPVPGQVGARGPAGPRGAQGPKGAQGLKGDPGPKRSSGNWGVINRNTIGSPSSELRSGPFEPPHGDGSLNLLVADGQEKAAYGNEIDFAGDEVGELTKVGFYVYTTGENITAGGGTPNMPSITFEIDPNLADPPTNYSSLVFVPGANSPANEWSEYIDATATGKWGLTGAAGTATGCPLSGGLCTFDEVLDALDDGGEPATILSAAVSKGRDFSWQGAVDGLTINDTVYDFEETGVSDK